MSRQDSQLTADSDKTGELSLPKNAEEFLKFRQYIEALIAEYKEITLAQRHNFFSRVTKVYEVLKIADMFKSPMRSQSFYKSQLRKINAPSPIEDLGNNLAELTRLFLAADFCKHPLFPGSEKNATSPRLSPDDSKSSPSSTSSPSVESSDSSGSQTTGTSARTSVPAPSQLSLTSKDSKRGAAPAPLENSSSFGGVCFVWENELDGFSIGLQSVKISAGYMENFKQANDLLSKQPKKALDACLDAIAKIEKDMGAEKSPDTHDKAELASYIIACIYAATNACEEMKDYAKAATLYEKAIDVISRHDLPIDWLTMHLYMCAGIYVKTQNFEAALAKILKAVEVTKNDSLLNAILDSYYRMLPERLHEDQKQKIQALKQRIKTTAPSEQKTSSTADSPTVKPPAKSKSDFSSSLSLTEDDDKSATVKDDLKGGKEVKEVNEQTSYLNAIERLLSLEAVGCRTTVADIDKAVRLCEKANEKKLGVRFIWLSWLLHRLKAEIHPAEKELYTSVSTSRLIDALGLEDRGLKPYYLNYDTFNTQIDSYLDLISKSHHSDYQFVLMGLILGLCWLDKPNNDPVDKFIKTGIKFAKIDEKASDKDKKAMAYKYWIASICRADSKQERNVLLMFIAKELGQPIAPFVPLVELSNRLNSCSRLEDSRRLSEKDDEEASPEVKLFASLLAAQALGRGLGMPQLITGMMGAGMPPPAFSVKPFGDSSSPLVRIPRPQRSESRDQKYDGPSISSRGNGF